MNIYESQIIIFKTVSFLFLAGTKHIKTQACSMNITQVVDFSLVNALMLCSHLYISSFYAACDFSTDLFFICISYVFCCFSPIFFFLNCVRVFYQFLDTESYYQYKKEFKRISLPLPTSLPILILLPVTGNSPHFRAFFLHLPQDWPYLMRALYESRGFRNLLLFPSFPYLLLLSLNYNFV